MVNTERNDRLFASLLANHEGWALWNKFSTSELDPGVFGYFDDDGAWKEIAQLRDDGQLQRDNWARLENPVEVKENTGSIAWGPKLSGQMRDWSLGQTLGGPVTPGIEVSATFKVQHGFERGAVMVTACPIIQTMTTDDRPLLQWLKKNAETIVQRYENEIKDHGLWIITKTYHTSRCALSILRSHTSEVTIDLVVDITGAASLGPATSWSSESHDYTSAVYEDEDYGVVVMICGIHISKRLFTSDIKSEGRREKQKILRGEAEQIPTEHICNIETVVNGSTFQFSVERLPPIR